MNSKFFLVLVIVVLFPFMALRAQHGWAWARCGNATIAATATDPDGNVYVAGTFTNDTVYFGSYMLTNPTQTFYPQNMFLVKYDVAGNLIWATAPNYVNEMNDYFYLSVSGLATDASGNIYIAGSIRADAINFGTISQTFLGPHGSVYFAKYNKDGSPVWVNSGRSNHLCNAGSVATDNMGHVYFVGNYNEVIWLGGVDLTGPETSTCMFLLRTDTAGNQQMLSKIVGSEQNIMALNSHYQPVVSGKFYDSVFAGSTTLTSSSTYIYFVAQMDSSGGVVWAAPGIPIPTYRTMAISADTSGNIFVSGSFDADSVSFGSVSLVKPSTDTTDIFLVKYDAAGNSIWAQTATGSGVDQVTAMGCDRNNNIYVTGYYQSANLNFSGTILNNSAPDSSYYCNFFVAKYDESGHTNWVITSNDTAYNMTNCLATCNPPGAVYIGGVFGFETALNFGADTLFTQGQGGGNINCFVARLDDYTAVALVHSAAEAVRIFPNPSSGQISVETEVSPIRAVKVIDAVGRQIVCKISWSSATQVSLDLSLVIVGNYIIHLETDLDCFSLPLVLIR